MRSILNVNYAFVENSGSFSSRAGNEVNFYTFTFMPFQSFHKEVRLYKQKKQNKLYHETLIQN
jgi:hypothetical protein